MKFLPRNLLIDCAVCLLLAFALVPQAKAQADKWDTMLNGSYWYVPQENLLAYTSSGTSFANPSTAGDQTLWSITSATNGVFSGSSIAYLGLNAVVSSTSASSMQGVVTEGGEIRIVFTSGEGATETQTTGIGQMQTSGTTTYMQMQMMTGQSGTGGLLVTHWAYMASYNPETFTPEGPSIDEGLRSQEWLWMKDTTWSLQDDALFGDGETGTFYITDYRNGYFWGTGLGPDGSMAESFTQMGSVTPEGTVLFNILLADGTLTSLTGLITGDASDGQMALRNYESAVFGSAAYASVIPEPGTLGLLGLGCAVIAAGLRRRLT